MGTGLQQDTLGCNSPAEAGENPNLLWVLVPESPCNLNHMSSQTTRMSQFYKQKEMNNNLSCMEGINKNSPRMQQIRVEDRVTLSIAVK